MKTTAEIDKAIAARIQEIKEGSKANSNDSTLLMLKQCKLYLQTDPRPESVIKQYNELCKKIEAFEDPFHFAGWCAGKGRAIASLTEQEKHKEHDKVFDLTKLRRQRKALEFILSPSITELA